MNTMLEDLEYCPMNSTTKSVLEVIGDDKIAQQLLYGFISCNDIPELYEALWHYYAVERAEMPYGTMKARDADPVEWIDRRVVQELQNEADLRTAEG